MSPGKLTAKSFDQWIKCCLNVQHNCIEGGCAAVEAAVPVNKRQEGTSVFYHIRHTNHNSYLLNAFAHHEAQRHRQLSGLRHMVVTGSQMMQALTEGLQKWQGENDGDDVSD